MLWGCRVYVLDGMSVALDTEAGVLILTLPDRRLHALWVLGFAAALAVASSAASQKDLLADLPWSADITLDESASAST